MNLKTLTNEALLAALRSAMEAVKNPRGSENLKQTRQRALFAIKAECARREW